MYREILLPTDGSEAARLATRHAIDLAEQYGSRLHALFVVDSAAYAALETGAQPVIEAITEEGRRATARIEAEAADAGIDAESAVETGSPHRRIVEYAAEHDIDLIVMATHGRTGLDRYLLGSVTERVVRTADCPVLTVGVTAEPAAAE
jgi:nucleotide-binding universal stress UspA family protein